MPDEVLISVVRYSARGRAEIAAKPTPLQEVLEEIIHALVGTRRPIGNWTEWVILDGQPHTLALFVDAPDPAAGAGAEATVIGLYSGLLTSEQIEH